jgi:hypothetical protein
MDGQLNSIDKLNREYVMAGEDLLRRLSLYGINDSQLPQNISLWVDVVTQSFLPLMPTDHSDYKIVNEIRSRYVENQSILLPSASTDIRKLLEHWKIAHQCVIAFLNADVRDVPPENLTNIYYDQLKELTVYVTANLIEKLKGREDGKTANTAILHIYGRMYLWVQSMIKLNKAEDTLALASCLRAIMELYVDINIMSCRADSKDIEKYFSFQKIEKWNKAKQVVKLRSDFNLVGRGETTPTDKYLAEPDNSEDKIKAIRTQLWGNGRKDNPINPKHWTNKTLIERIRFLNNKDIVEIYILSYTYCNFLVHSTYYGSISDVKNAHLFNYNNFVLVSKMFLIATDIVNKTTNALPKAELEKQFAGIEAEAFKRCFNEMAKVGRKKVSV